MKGDRMAKRSSFGSIVRKRLSDITNSLPQTQHKSPIDVDKFSPDVSSMKDYINHLAKENVALVKLVQDKNKIIELSGIEIQKMRIHLQKMQLQNWNLAQSNSHMLAELNLNREKMKSLQHELVCKEALLKSRNLEEEQEQREQLKNNMQDEEFMAIDSQLNKHSKPRNGNRRQRATRSQSMGHSTSSQQSAEKEAAENKRRCLRRKSTNSKIQQSEPAAEDLFELEGLAVPFNSPVHEDDLTPLPFSSVEEVMKDSSENVAQISRRTSSGRPSRKAAEKVQSYKEIPVNIKMRR
ncbi:PREDICTED: shugoshin-1 [Nicotiana attenuata]|uniref:Shugoshin-1 n=1 Tax=Nicotiana attenuata TaxID=49451 RepID=A0A314L2X6_NICAT|nr:PREDICTED: shugoshin-1 [Nicotiana attenuata]OIT35852.1 shugoshin-1 [Nicotiana attenuata]